MTHPHVYLCRVSDPKGSLREIPILALGRPQAFHLARQKSLDVLRCRRLWTASEPRFKKSFLLKYQQIFLNLSELIGSGLTLVHALDALADEMDLYIRCQLKALRDRLQEGAVLSAIWGSRWEGPLIRAFLSLGEKTGNLPSALKGLSESLGHIEHMRSVTFESLRYPLIVFLCLLGTFSVWFTQVLPEVLELMRVEMHQTSGENVGLGFASRSLLSFQTFLITYGFQLSILLGIICGGLIVLARFYPPVRFLAHGLSVRIPFLGRMRLGTLWARFFYTWGILLTHQIPLLEGLREAGEHIQNPFLKTQLMAVSLDIRGGSSVSSCFFGLSGISSRALQMIVWGEKTGSLGPALIRISHMYQRNLEEMRSRLIAYLQPLSFLALGGMILWLISGLLLPMYNTFGGGGLGNV